MKKTILFKIMNHKGDAALAYDIESAQEKFKELSLSMVPMEKTNDGLELVESLRDDLKEIVWLPKIAGG